MPLPPRRLGQRGFPGILSGEDEPYLLGGLEILNEPAAPFRAVRGVERIRHLELRHLITLAFTIRAHPIFRNTSITVPEGIRKFGCILM